MPIDPYKALILLQRFIGRSGILLGLYRFACVPTSGTSMLLAVSKACLGTSSAATLATPWAGTLLGLCRFACVPTTCTSMRCCLGTCLPAGIHGALPCRMRAHHHAFSGFEGAVWAPRLQPHWPPLGLESCWGSAVSHACPPSVPPCF